MSEPTSELDRQRAGSEMTPELMALSRAGLAAKTRQCRDAMNAGDYGAATVALMLEIKQAEDTPRRLVDIPTSGRCATCRWAEADNADFAPYRSLTLVCERSQQVDSLFAAGSDRDDDPPPVYVAPEFGCIQWEAKPDV